MKEIIPVPNDRERIAKFKPRARLLLQLGDQLIKNESIALLELATFVFWRATACLAAL